MLRSILHNSKIVPAVFAGLLVVYLVTVHQDWLNCLSSPETTRGTRRLVVLEDSQQRGSYDRIAETIPAWREMSATDVWRALDRAAGKSEEASGDFDGDGVPDRLDVEYYHQEPLFSKPTSGIAMVVSGATGRTLLAVAVSTPMDRAHWCGDLDGNGTDDVLVVQIGNAVVFGSERAASKR